MSFCQEVKDHFEWLEQIQTMSQGAGRLTGLVHCPAAPPFPTSSLCLPVSITAGAKLAAAPPGSWTLFQLCPSPVTGAEI